MIQLGPFPLTLKNEVIGSREWTNEKASLQIPVNLDCTFSSRYTQTCECAAWLTHGLPSATVRCMGESTKFHTATFC